MRSGWSGGSETRNSSSWWRTGPVLLALAGVVLAGAVVLLSSGQTPAPQLPAPPPHPIILPEANRPPDANAQMQMREQKQRKQNFDAANAERLRQMTQATLMLETMAMALKAEVDKADSISESTVHKAETIEKLARLVQDKMKLTVAPN